MNFSHTTFLVALGATAIADATEGMKKMALRVNISFVSLYIGTLNNVPRNVKGLFKISLIIGILNTIKFSIIESFLIFDAKKTCYDHAADAILDKYFPTSVKTFFIFSDNTFINFSLLVIS